MNRKLRFLSIAAAGALSLGAAAFLSSQEMPKPKSNPGFDQLKSLAGEWEGVNAGGKSVHVEYEVVSNGSALMERLHPMGEMEMVTMYSADGDRVAVTHYCSAGNQPQMQTEVLSGPAPKYAFNFVRATNLAGPGAGHMEKLVLNLPDHDHLIQEWTWVESGKPAHIEAFHFTRKK